MKILYSFCRVVGLDKAIGFSVANSAIQALFLFATATSISRHLTAVEQGYYYTFLSIIGLQSLFELGFGQVITQNIAHAHAALSKENSDYVSRGAARVMIDGLNKFSEIYYLGSSVVFIIVVGLGGYLFFERSPSSSIVDWRVSWILFIISTGSSVRITAKMAVIEGLGGIQWITRTRFWVNTLRSGLVLLLISLDFRLSALATGVAFYYIATWVVSTKKKKRMLSDATSLSGPLTLQHPTHVDLLRQLWPMQSRLALSYMCGFFIFAATNPILLAYTGPEAAARFGITWSLLQGVSGIAISWNATKSAVYGGLAGSGRVGELWLKWRHTYLQSMGVCIFGLGLVLCYLGFGVRMVGTPDRFLSLSETIPLAIAILLIVTSYAMALYARCQLKEILAPASLVNAVAAVVLVSLSAIYMQFKWVPWSYLASFAISSAVTIPTFFRFRRKVLSKY